MPRYLRDYEIRRYDLPYRTGKQRMRRYDRDLVDRVREGWSELRDGLTCALRRR